jgi:hypothetical protein
MSSSIDTSKSSDAHTADSITPTRQSVPSSAHGEIYSDVPIPLPSKLYRGVTASLRVLPDFLIIGTQRGGTTSLYRYLKAHPCFGAPSNKDIHFFDRRYRKGLTWYRGHFPAIWEKAYAQQIRKRPFLTGEASPSYLFHPHASRRIAEALPDVKLIVLLRNPVSRAYSQYHHAVELGFETLSFEEAIRHEEERTAKEREKIFKDEHYYSEEYKHRSYLTKGIYVDQLQTWMRFFPRERFLILKSEDFNANPAAAFKQVLTFLNLPETELAVEKQNYKQYNANTYPSKMDAARRARLVEYFQPHNVRLYELLGIDFGWDK